MEGTAQRVAPARVAPPAEGLSYAVRFADGSALREGRGEPKFTVRIGDLAHWRKLLASNAYAVAHAYVAGEFDLEGDFVEAACLYERQPRPASLEWMLRAAGRLDPLLRIARSRSGAARDVRFHYDRSNEFYRLFLDQRMVYSCAYFREPGYSLDDAQAAKLDLICRKLDLRAGERFLDIGCGWGALLLHAAERFGVCATGCTVSARQFDYAGHAARRSPAHHRLALYETDYQDLNGNFDKIASIGMFEHVGRPRLPGYFRKVCNLLADGGLFLNHGIIRPAGVEESAETLFMRRFVFPGTELVTLGEAVTIAEQAGFEVLDVENLRPHYGLTCRAWLDRLGANEEACKALVGEHTYRTWRLAFAGFALCFEEGWMDLCQILMSKRSYPRAHRMTREYMYG